MPAVPKWLDRILGERPPSRLARLLSRHEELAWALGAGVVLLLTWLFSLSGRPADWLPIPPFIATDEELLRYLADVCHEGATPERPDVRWA